MPKNQPSKRRDRQTATDLQRQIEGLQAELVATARAALEAETRLKAQQPVVDAALIWSDSPLVREPLLRAAPDNALFDTVENYRAGRGCGGAT